jgi:hypothetical protein
MTFRIPSVDAFSAIQPLFAALITPLCIAFFSIFALWAQSYAEKVSVIVLDSFSALSFAIITIILSS